MHKGIREKPLKKSSVDEKSKTELKIKRRKSKSKDKKTIKTSLTTKVPH